MEKQKSSGMQVQSDRHDVPDNLERELAGWPEPLDRLRSALAQNEFVLYGQPVVDLTMDACPIMAEALVRLKEEEAALLPPGDFLPAFEHFRMMPELDRWVVGRAITFLEQGLRVARISINVARQSLQDRRFPSFIAEAVMASGVSASNLVFEIDESAILGHLEDAARFAGAIRAIGCGVLVDSFGAHGVSFAPLKSIHADFVKVDGSIVRSIARSPVARTKMNAIVRVGNTLGFDLVAEGVEDQHMLASLKVYGVRYVQGHGISRPLPMSALLQKRGNDGVERGLSSVSL